jgi:hypothetical protein
MVAYGFMSMYLRPINSRGVDIAKVACVTSAAGRMRRRGREAPTQLGVSSSRLHAYCWL